MFVRCVATAIAGLLLTACAAEAQKQPWHWEKPNVDQTQFNKDVCECMKKSRGNPAWDSAYGFNPVMRDACMRARGYQQVRNLPQRR